MTRAALAIAVSWLATWPLLADAWVLLPHRYHPAGPSVGVASVGRQLHPLLLRQQSSSLRSSSSSETLEIVECSGDEASILEASTFMVDSFWLGSSRHLLQARPQEQEERLPLPVSDALRSALIEEQIADFMENYGERLGQRLLETGIVLARDGDDGDQQLLGMVCLAETLFDQEHSRVLPISEAETLLKDAVAALGPKQRRQYKDASALEIVQLLPGKQAVCCLSNLAVAPAARRRGVALQLCRAVEEAVATNLGYDSLMLLVERDNAHARRLYEDKLGYRLRCTLEGESALRVDTETGGFVETQADTLLLVKDLHQQ